MLQNERLVATFRFDAAGKKLPEAEILATPGDFDGPGNPLGKPDGVENLVDLAKSVQTKYYSSSIYLQSIGFVTAENEPLKVCQQLANC